MRRIARRDIYALALVVGGLAAAGAATGCGGGQTVVQTTTTPSTNTATQGAGLSGRELVGLTMSLPAGETRTLSVKCPQGKASMGGGFDTEAPSVNVLSSTPFNAGNGWRVRANNAGSATATVYINAVCAEVG
jgi:hypothetical protein